jgi:glycosyltransferase involved in cell wall biosynthesis
MSSYDHVFTVFTPTFNRARTLERVYSSLEAQTFRDFEWLIVDDGSADGTRALVDKWQRQASFAIRYSWQENRGKHVAFNAAVRDARGELFLPLDSDDACVPHALERFREHWESIPASERPRFTGVTALCQDQYGHVVGSPFPSPVVDSNSLEIRFRFRVTGEKWGFHRTDVLREYPFPDIRATHVPESVVWMRIARRYATRYVNDVLRIYYIEGPSLSHGHAPVVNSLGGRLHHLTLLNEHIDYLRLAPTKFFVSAADYARFSFHVGLPLRRQIRDIDTPQGRVLWSLAIPAGWLLYRRDVRRSAAQVTAANA